MESLNGPLLFAGFNLSGLINFLYVGIGLGLVIFFHELGHFAVAKWCGVFVERFSIGFGPIIFGKKYGDTEYVLSVIPFGGYVKMLGQDDADPSQLTSDELAQDPQSYTSKNVWQRMAIISAGVIMNVITGTMFYAVAFGLGVNSTPPVIGAVPVGTPAWQAGLEPGDRITHVNEKLVQSFQDAALSIILSPQGVRLQGEKRAGGTFDLSIQPERGQGRPSIGILPSSCLTLAELADQRSPTNPSLSASRATPELKGGDTIQELNGQAISTFAEFQLQLAKAAGKPVELTVQPKSKEDAIVPKKTVAIEPNTFLTFGFILDTGPISAIKTGSVAEKAGIKVGDKLAVIDGKNIGTDLDPLRLPEYFAARAGESLEVVVRRQEQGKPPQNVTISLEPTDRPGWIEPPVSRTDALSIPALGLAFPLVPVVIHVTEDSPADKAGIKPNSLLKTMTLLPKKVGDKDLKAIEYRFVEESSTKSGGTWEWLSNFLFGPPQKKKVDQFQCAFWELQLTRDREVSLVFEVPGKADEEKTVELKPVEDPDWPYPLLGIIPSPLQSQLKAANFAEACHMAWMHARNSAVSIYLTLKGLGTRDISPTELNGPIAIFQFAYRTTSDEGISSLMLFLAYLSINLAVVNFLPIPVLDGGHMVFLIWEAVTRRKPSEKVVLIASYIGLIFILTLMVFVLGQDLIRLIFGR